MEACPTLPQVFHFSNRRWWRDGDIIADLEAGRRGQDLLAPASATHVGFSSAYARINFREQEKSSFSEELLLALDGNITDLVLTTPPVPELEGGISILVLKIVFYQEINNSLNLLNDKNHCAIEIISAGFPA